MSIDLHTMSGAYVLHALSVEEAEEFRKHLDECPACRDEVRELRETTAEMGAVEAVAPPARLRAGVLAAADRTAQLPPRTTVTPLRRRRLGPALLAAAATVAVVLAGVVGISQLDDDQQGTATTLATSVVRVLQADDAVKQRVNTPQGSVTVAASPQLNEMAIDTDELATLDDGHDYQLWAIGDGEVSSVGIVDPDKGASMEMPAPGTQVAITVEPAGGSPQPTTKPLFQVDPGKA